MLPPLAAKWWNSKALYLFLSPIIPVPYRNPCTDLDRVRMHVPQMRPHRSPTQPPPSPRALPELATETRGVQRIEPRNGDRIGVAAWSQARRLSARSQGRTRPTWPSSHQKRMWWCLWNRLQREWRRSGRWLREDRERKLGERVWDFGLP